MDSENGRMTREEYRAQMGLDAEPNAKREKSGDAGARLILLQLIICAAAVGLIFGIRKLSPASFETIKNTYKSAMQYSINAREAWGKIKSAAGFVFEPAGALADSDKDFETSTESLGKGSSELNVKAYRMSFSPYYTTMSAHMPVSVRRSAGVKIRLRAKRRSIRGSITRRRRGVRFPPHFTAPSLRSARMKLPESISA